MMLNNPDDVESIRLALAFDDVEVAVILQVTEGGHQTLYSMQRVFVDTQHSGRVLVLPFLSFEVGGLCVNPAHTGRT